jgi:hypothetical protein
MCYPFTQPKQEMISTASFHGMLVTGHRTEVLAFHYVHEGARETEGVFDLARCHCGEGFNSQRNSGRDELFGDGGLKNSGCRTFEGLCRALELIGKGGIPCLSNGIYKSKERRILASSGS